MDEVLGDAVVEVLDVERRLDLLDAVLERGDDPLLLVDLVVDVALQTADDRREAVVQLGGVGDATGDDQRCAGLVDEDRVDLVDDRVHVAPLGLVRQLRDHVVAEVVEAELVVRAVGDVGRVLSPLLLGRGVAARDDEADVQAEPAVDAAHPLGVERRQVLVDGDHVHAPAGDTVEVGGQRGDEGLALAGLHLGDPAEVEGGAAHELDIEVALSDDPDRGLAADGEGLEQQVVEILAPFEPRAELSGLRRGGRRRTAPASPTRGR